MLCLDNNAPHGVSTADLQALLSVLVLVLISFSTVLLWNAIHTHSYSCIASSVFVSKESYLSWFSCTAGLINEIQKQVSCWIPLSESQCQLLSNKCTVPNLSWFLKLCFPDDDIQCREMMTDIDFRWWSIQSRWSLKDYIKVQVISRLTNIQWSITIIRGIFLSQPHPLCPQNYWNCNIF